MDALVIGPFPEAALHLATVLGRGPLAGPPGIDGDHARSNAQHLSTEAMVPLAVVSGIGENTIPVHQGGRLSKGGGKAGRVIARPLANMTADPQIRAGVAQDCQLGPVGAAKALGAGSLVEVVETDVADFKAG